MSWDLSLRSNLYGVGLESENINNIQNIIIKDMDLSENLSRCFI